jgi:transcriptional regulator of met regulon
MNISECILTIIDAFYCKAQQAKRQWNRKRFSTHGRLMEDTIKHFMDKGLTHDDKDIKARVCVIQEDRKNVMEICKREVDKLLKNAANIKPK